jgi:diguanylate cyclase (GGDEF)-like protein
MLIADALQISDGGWAMAGLAAILLLAVCAGFLAGVWCAPTFQAWSLRRASRHIQRVAELTARQLDDASRLCRLLGDFTDRELSPLHWDRLDHARTQLADAWHLVTERHRPTTSAAETTPTTPFHAEWQRGGLDATTNLPDRAAAELNLDLLLAGSRSHSQPSGVLLVRMDKGDQLRKRYGTDAVVKLQARLATVIVKSVRDEDFVGRWQADEFLVLLPSLSPIAGARVADAVRSAIRQHLFRLVDAGPEVLVTASLGYACALPTDSSPMVLDRATEALQKSQAAGRNQLHLHDATHRTAVRVG